MQERSDRILNYNNLIADLQQDSEKAAEKVVEIQENADRHVQTVADSTLQLGQVMMACENIYQRCMTKTHVQRKEVTAAGDQDDTAAVIEKLNFISDYMIDLQFIVKLARPVAVPSASAAGGVSGVDAGGAGGGNAPKNTSSKVVSARTTTLRLCVPVTAVPTAAITPPHHSPPLVFRVRVSTGGGGAALVSAAIGGRAPVRQYNLGVVILLRYCRHAQARAPEITRPPEMGARDPFATRWLDDASFARGSRRDACGERRSVGPHAMECERAAVLSSRLALERHVACLRRDLVSRRACCAFCNILTTSLTTKWKA